MNKRQRLDKLVRKGRDGGGLKDNRRKGVKLQRCGDCGGTMVLISCAAVAKIDAFLAKRTGTQPTVCPSQPHYHQVCPSQAEHLRSEAERT